MRKTILFAMMLPCTMSGQAQEDSWNSLEKFQLAEKSLVQVLLSTIQQDTKGEFWVFERGDTIRDSGMAAMRVIEANQVKVIYNVPFGVSYEKAKKILKEKYGECNYSESSEGCMTYRNKLYGGVLYSDLYFLFQSDGKNSHFYKAVLCRNCNSMKEAVELKRSLDEMFREQFSIFRILDDETSIGGLSPIESKDTGSYGFLVDIIENKHQGRNSGSPYAVRIIYGPYNYFKE